MPGYDPSDPEGEAARAGSLEAKLTLRPVILAGGYGTRLWPLSREDYPKQFLPLVSKRTLLQETICRLDGVQGAAAPLIVCNEAHRFLVTEQVRELGEAPFRVILEPASRNTAPALSLAALWLVSEREGRDADPIMLVMPADHVIRDVAAFQAAVREGEALATRGLMVTFGISPTRPETGYGYIAKGAACTPVGERLRAGRRPPPGTRTALETDDRGVGHPRLAGAFFVSRFVEKPDAATARAYLGSGDFLWNSGIFMMRASVWLEELERYRPDIAGAVAEACARWRRDGVFLRPDGVLFAGCPAESIDYAVMEKAADAHHDSSEEGGASADGSRETPALCAVVPLDAGWSDVGAWSSLWEEGARDGRGNVTSGDVYAADTGDSLLIANSRLLAAVGVEDLVVVETTDAVLVARKGRVQDVKEIVARLKADGRPEQANHRKVHRPWGSFETVAEGPTFQVKRLTVRPGASLSLQKHHHRAENWVVVRGTARVTRGEETFELTEDQSTHIPAGGVHRLANPGSIPLEVIEVQVGSYLGEDDIVRFDDDYNRHNA